MLSTYIKNGSNKNYIITFVIVLSLFFAERFFHEKLRVKLEKIVKSEASKLNPLNSVSRVDYFYLPPKVLVEELNFIDDERKVSLQAEKGSLSLRFFSLIGGKVKLKRVAIKNANLKVDLNTKIETDKSDMPKINLAFLLKSIPIEAFSLKNTNVHLNDKSTRYSLKVSSMLFEKSAQKMWLQANVNNSIQTKTNQFGFKLNTNLNWGPNGIFITSLNAKKDNSQISLTGLFKEDIIYDLIDGKGRNPLNNTHEIRSSSQIELTELQDLYSFLSRKNKEKLKFIKNASGSIKVKGNLLAEEDLDKEREGRIKVLIKDLKTQFTDLQELNFAATVKSSSLESENLNIIFSDQSKLSFKKIELTKEKGHAKINLEASSKYLELRDILNGINAKATNIKIPFALKGKCSGRLGKNTLLKCQSSGKVISGKVKSPGGKGAIVDINSANFKLESFITSKDIKLQVEANREDSSGSATGVIDFDKGFSVDFEAPKLNFTKFVNEIASSSLNGEGSLKGNVSGTSRTARFVLSADNSSTEFNDLTLGATKLNVSYKYPLVLVSDVEGLLETKPYSGDIRFDVESEILDIDLMSESLGSKELRVLFVKKFDFPEDINFDGSLKVSASGEPNIDKMDLHLESNLKDITVFTESFENGKLILKGDKGRWELYEALLLDQKKAVSATGHLNGLKTLDVKLESARYNASQINFLKNLGLNLNGPMSFSLEAKGPLEGPKATGQIFSKVNGSYRKMGSVAVDYRLYQDGIDWSGELFSKSIVGKGYLPFKADQPFSFDGKLTDFDIINILSVAKDSAKKPLSKLSGEFSKVKTNNIATGRMRGGIKNTSLTLSAGDIKTLHLKQDKDTQSFASKINFSALQDDVPNSKFIVYFKNLNNMSFSSQGLLDLDFVEPFISGTEQLNAILESDFEIKTQNGVTKGKGSSFLKGVTYRNSSFPYTFNSGKSKINWYSDHASFTETSTFLNGSEIKGSGRVNYSPSFFIDFAFKHKNLRVELPDKIHTNSNGRLYISGSKLPLNLSGNINVEGGLFALDILNSSSTSSVQPSHLLPSKLLNEDSSPFNLNLDINFIRPFEINNAEVKGFATGKLNAHGLTSNPRLTGKVDIQKGTKLIFQDKQFIVNEGRISYQNKSPNNPTMFIDSESELTDKNSLIAKDYSVRVIIKGTGSNPKLDFSSQPSLEENQIISLIAIGTTSTQTLDQEIGQEQQATQSGLQVGSYLLQQNQAVKDFQNQTGTELELSSSVDSGGVNPKVGIKKAWTPKFSSNLSQTFGNQKQISLDNKYKINKNLSTVIKLQNSKTDDASLIINRRVPDGNILGLDLEYNVEFK